MLELSDFKAKRLLELWTDLTPAPTIADALGLSISDMHRHIYRIRDDDIRHDPPAANYWRKVEQQRRRISA